jgi:aryl-alcohol dehydrogenase-like predicted oxidoreductase
MERRALGRSGLMVPVIGMGTWKTFDVHGQGDVAARRTVVDAALGAGTDLFDSSPMYGHAEAVLGEALNGRRAAALVATKVWTPDDAEAERQIQHAFAFYDGRVDLYQVHNLVAWQKRLARLEQLHAEGSVKAIGITHYQHASFDDLMQIMRSGRVTAVQVPYNPTDRVVEQRLLPLAGELNIGVLVMRPLGVGALARLPITEQQLAPFREFGVQTWPQALLKWLISDSRITTVIPATSSPDHARDNAAAGEPPWFEPEQRAYVARLAGG